MANISHFTQTVNGVSTTYDIHDANAIPRSGGAVITGDSLGRTVNNSNLLISGGTGGDDGASILLYGKDSTVDAGVCLIKIKDNTNGRIIALYPSGQIDFGSDFHFNSDVTFQVGSSSGLFTRIRYDGMIWSNSNLIYPANNLMGLGNGSNKWKSFNGVNPGALSLPSNSYVNVDTTNWELTCQNELMGCFTPTADGWLMLHVTNSGTNEVNFWIIGGVIRINSKSTLNTSDNKNFNMITIPVEKDNTYNIYGNASEYVAGRSIAYCRFMPCQGNV